MTDRLSRCHRPPASPVAWVVTSTYCLRATRAARRLDQKKAASETKDIAPLSGSKVPAETRGTTGTPKYKPPGPG
jgi:hypothetical protein